MPEKKSKEPIYTARQLALLLGCSLRSIYRWEKAGVIPAATRIKRGGVSARIYTASQAEAIRQKVQGRLDLAAATHQPGFEGWEDRGPGGGLFPSEPFQGQNQYVYSALGRAFAKLFPFGAVMFPHESAPLFMRAMKFAQEHGCEALTITAPGGRTETFSLVHRKKEAVKKAS